MKFIYHIFITCYALAIRFASIWNEKAEQWYRGRKDLFTEFQKKIANDNIIWMHCSSAGEFEQGKPILKKLREQYPHYKLLVSFFSPSGFNVAKGNNLADYICYIPLDTRSNAEQFLKTVNPQLVIFVKYEFWYHHLKAIHNKKIPLLLISAIFREQQLFFKWYGSFYFTMLRFFSWIFVQDEQSYNLLRKNKISNCSIGGDTRFDRVISIADTIKEVPFIKEFIGHNKVIVAGSTWSNDEDILSEAITGENLKIIIAPHEVDKAHIENILKQFPNAITYSVFKENPGNSFTTLIIDSIGLLSQLYYYATITYVGGGFNKSGIHNTLEAAVYGKPVIFGPNYQKFKEAEDLMSANAAFSIKNKQELHEVIERLINDSVTLQQCSKAAKNYVYNSSGATEKIMAYIDKNRLLTT
ncbi:MAG: 3-deoxy-D-manno-octulosonic acid transferase [Chitinophagaceae bacterium]